MNRWADLVTHYTLEPLPDGQTSLELWFNETHIDSMTFYDQSEAIGYYHFLIS